MGAPTSLVYKITYERVINSVQGPVAYRLGTGFLLTDGKDVATFG